MKKSKSRADLESEGDQVRERVAAKDDRSEAAGDDGEKKSGCNDVFHSGHSDITAPSRRRKRRRARSIQL
jgi:hypothetical protein